MKNTEIEDTEKLYFTESFGEECIIDGKECKIILIGDDTFRINIQEDPQENNVFQINLFGKYYEKEFYRWRKVCFKYDFSKGKILTNNKSLEEFIGGKKSISNLIKRLKFDLKKRNNHIDTKKRINFDLAGILDGKSKVASIPNMLLKILTQ